MIRFGSRTEVDLPLEAEILVKLREKSPGRRNTHRAARTEPGMNANEEPKIYLLPNLMTAGNLFCGFAAILRIIEAALVIQQGGSAVVLYHQALTFVLGACLFDLLDGRLARLGGSESPFGREFDSLADVVSLE